MSQRVYQIPSGVGLCKYSQRLWIRFTVEFQRRFNLTVTLEAHNACIWDVGTCAQTSICKIKMTKKISKSFYLCGSYRRKQLRADDYMECLPILKTFLKGYFHTFKTSSKLERVFVFSKIQSSPFGHDIYSRQWSLPGCKTNVQRVFT